MTLEELLKDERAEERTEAILDLLEDIGTVPKELREKIQCTYNMETLKKWFKLAAKADSIEQFMEQIQ